MKEERKRKERQINSEEGRKERSTNRKEFIYNYKIKKSCTLQEALYNAQNGTRTDRQTDRQTD